MTDCKFEVGKTYKRRDGEDALLVFRHVYFDADCLVWVVDGKAGAFSTNVDGTFYDELKNCKLDVLPPKQSGDFFLNIYLHDDGAFGIQHNTVDAAKASQSSHTIARVRVSWEEGQFDD